MKVSQLRERERRTNGLEYYNYAYAFRTKRFSQSPIIDAIHSGVAGSPAVPPGGTRNLKKK
jgi:hypothetical protein